MSNSPMSMVADDGGDDLPRTLRRAREERMREAESHLPPPGMAPGQGSGYGAADARPNFLDTPDGVTVTAIKVPFTRLVAFFLKAALAAIPAIILLGVVIWFAMATLKAVYPQLIHMQVVISAPK